MFTGRSSSNFACLLRSCVLINVPSTVALSVIEEKLLRSPKKGRCPLPPLITPRFTVRINSDFAPFSRALMPTYLPNMVNLVTVDKKLSACVQKTPRRPQKISIPKFLEIGSYDFQIDPTILCRSMSTTKPRENYSD